MEEQKFRKFYLVTAKCGHVGKYRFIEVQFPVCAESAHEASQKVLNKPKVKRQLKNAISDVKEINENEYINKKRELHNNSYISSHTKKEIINYIEDAKYLGRMTKKYKNSFSSRLERVQFLLKKYSSRGLN